MAASRALTPTVALIALALGACANRGMKMHVGDGGPDPGDGAEGPEVPGDDARDGAGEGTLTDGGGGSGGGATDADDDGPDASVERPPVVCSARFNFENGLLYGAVNNRDCVGCFTAFTSIRNGSTTTLCGNGALEINATFSGTGSATLSTGGEVLLPLTGAGEDLTGKTITINVAAVPRADATFFLLVVTPSGYQTVPGFPISLNRDGFSAKSYTFTAADGGISGMTSVSKLSLEAFSYTTAGYTGKIILDEIRLE